MAIEKEYGKFVPTCDGCGETLDPCDSFDEAKESMEAEGWSKKLLQKGSTKEWVNMCPACQEEDE